MANVGSVAKHLAGLRNVEELMAERGLIVDHTTVWRWCQKYGPVVYQRLKGKVNYKTTTWHMDENLHSGRRAVDLPIPYG
jgi:transposase-like protein